VLVNDNIYHFCKSLESQGYQTKLRIIQVHIKLFILEKHCIGICKAIISLIVKNQNLFVTGVVHNRVGIWVPLVKLLMEFLVLVSQIPRFYLSWLLLAKSRKYSHTAWILSEGVGYLLLEMWRSPK
jgi:hypothetical protein